jgi:hypothetical protein
VLLLVGDVLFLLLRVVIVQDDLDDLHGVVPHLLDLALGPVHRFPPLVFLLLYQSIAELKLVLLEVIVQVAQQFAAALGELLVGAGLFNAGEKLGEAAHTLLGEGVLVDE